MGQAQVVMALNKPAHRDVLVFSRAAWRVDRAA